MKPWRGSGNPSSSSATAANEIRSAPTKYGENCGLCACRWHGPSSPPCGYSRYDASGPMWQNARRLISALSCYSRRLQAQPDDDTGISGCHELEAEELESSSWPGTLFHERGKHLDQLNTHMAAARCTFTCTQRRSSSNVTRGRLCAKLEASVALPMPAIDVSSPESGHILILILNRSLRGFIPVVHTPSTAAVGAKGE